MTSVYGSSTAPTCPIHGVILTQRIFDRVFGYVVRSPEWHCLVCDAEASHTGEGEPPAATA